jgi:hypothetical protein
MIYNLKSRNVMTLAQPLPQDDVCEYDELCV